VVDPRLDHCFLTTSRQALLKINDHINALHIDAVEQRVLREEVETLVLKLAEASKRHHIRYPIGG